MKRIFYIVVLTLAAITSCQKNDGPKTLNDLLCNEWKLTSPMEANVYLAFAADGTFEEYQRLDNGHFELRRGSWSLAGNVISGRYNDNKEWSSSYTASVTGNTLLLVSKGDDGIEYQYKACQIPDIIRQTADIIVKSAY